MIAFIEAHRMEHGVEPICKVLPIASSTYYAGAATARDPSRASGRLAGMPRPCPGSGGFGRRTSRSTAPARSGFNFGPRGSMLPIARPHG